MWTSPCRARRCVVHGVAVLVHGGHLEREDLAHHAAAHDVVGRSGGSREERAGDHGDLHRVQGSLRTNPLDQHRSLTYLECECLYIRAEYAEDDDSCSVECLFSIPPLPCRRPRRCPPGTPPAPWSPLWPASAWPTARKSPHRRGLHTCTFRFTVSTSCGIRGVQVLFRGCTWGV